MQINVTLRRLYKYCATVNLKKKIIINNIESYIL